MNVGRLGVAYQRFRHSDRETRAFLLGRWAGRALSSAAKPLYFLAAVLLRVALIALKPIVHVRFGRMYSHAMGIWTVSLESYLCERDAGVQPTHTHDVFYHYNADRGALKHPPKSKDQACNRQLNLMFSRELHISQFGAALDRLNRMLPKGSENFIVKVPSSCDQTGVMDPFPPHLTFTEEEEQRGSSGLRGLGVEPGSKFICFHARDKGYVAQFAPRWVSLYGDWADGSHRNAAISNQVLAAQKLTELGYYAIRMGKYVEDPVHSGDPRIIDYAYESHDDFMDVYLSAHCTFLIGGNSGMTSLPQVFKRPVVFVNMCPFGEIIYSGANDIFIPKNYYSAEKGELLTFREILTDRRFLNYPRSRFFGAVESREFYNQIGLEFVDNTPEEIAELAIEMEQRLKGTFEPSREDDALRERFHAILRSHQQVSALGTDYDVHRLRIGAHFIRTHQELLE